MRIAVRYALFALLIFTPLARGSVQPWAVTVIEMVTLFAFTLFLLEKCIAWEWKWIKTPLDKPIITLIILSIAAIIFSLHKQTSIRSFTLFSAYLVIFYLIINTVRTRSQFRQLIYVVISVAIFLSIFGLFKELGANPFPWWDYVDLNYGDRLTSTFGCPNHLAGYIEMSLPPPLPFFCSVSDPELPLSSAI